MNSDQAGSDPILLSSRAAVTDPFIDFSVDRVSKLSLSRTYNSADYDLTVVATGGVFGNAWHHDWEGYLTCADDICTVTRGTLGGFQYQFSANQPSLDGSETWEVYLPHAVYPFTPPHHSVLVRKPSGEWVTFMTDGRELHFATTCTTCDSAGGPYCTVPESGGRARLVRVVDPAGNGITLGYDPRQGVLLRLNDDLGHALELHGASACAAYANELRYDGQVVARYTTASSRLQAVTDAGGAAMRTYAYATFGQLRPRLQSVQNEGAAAVAEFSYDSTGNAIGVVDANSSVAVSYSSDGWSSTVTEYFRGPLGDTNSSTTRTLDYSGNVTAVGSGSSAGPAKNLVWTPGGRVGCTIDEEGHVVYQDHDNAGRVTYRLEYTGDTCVVPAVLPADAREEWREYGATKPVAQGVVLDLDTATRVVRRSNLVANGFAEEDYDYNQSVNPIDPSGYSCASAALPAGSGLCRQFSSGYVTGSAGTRLERHATFHSYDAKGRLVRTYGPVNLDAPGANDVPPIEERTYWADGETAARQGRLREVKQFASPVAQPLVTSYDYDVFGASLIVGPDGGQTRVAKDARGRPTVVTQADRSGAIHASGETRYYDGLTPRLRILATGAAERYSYDGRGRLAKLERLSADPEAPSAHPALIWVEHYAYDQAGNRVHSERVDARGNVVWAQDRAFDVQHHVVWESNPSLPSAGKNWTYDAAGFVRQAVDEEGRGTTFTPDGLGRVRKIQRTGWDAEGSPASLDVATYSYGASSDTLAGVLDADGHPTAYSYDDFGRVERVTAATLAQPARWFRYDARGNVVQQGDSTVTVTFTYDGLDRLLARSATNSADGSAVAYQYVYDEGADRGRLTTILEPDRMVGFTYDWAGRILSEAVTEAGISAPLETQYRYDGNGAVVQVTHPTGLSVTYARDPASGEVVSVTNAVEGSAFATGIVHDPKGLLTSLTFGNGRTLEQTFTLRGEPLTVASGPLALTHVPSPAGDVSIVMDRSEDPSGCVHGSTRSFGYDLLDRLVGWSDSVATGPNQCPAETIGDLASGYDYVEGTDRIASQWVPDTNGQLAYAFGYDLQGNVSAIGQYDASGSSIASAVCLRHDALGRLARVGYTSTTLTPGGTACVLDSDVSGTLAQFRYDAQNRRIARQVNGEWTYFVADSSGSLLSELAPTSDPVNPWRRLRDYVWLDGRLLAQIEYGGGEPQTYYVHTDHLGTPHALTSATGALVWSTYQRPYGEVGEKTVPDPLTGQTVVTNLRLPGQYDERLLGPLGLQGPYYNWNRWYLPGVGRYLEPDPIAMAGGFNGEFGPDWYGYAGQNPLLYVDPNGEWKVHGNWCGPDWTGGKEEQYDPAHAGGYGAPTDGLDGACKNHDICYYQCRQDNPCDKDKRSECFKKCDKVLANRAAVAGGWDGIKVTDAMLRPGKRDPGPNDPKCPCDDKKK